jgi:hypothetical protein
VCWLTPPSSQAEEAEQDPGHANHRGRLDSDEGADHFLDRGFEVSRDPQEIVLGGEVVSAGKHSPKGSGRLFAENFAEPILWLYVRSTVISPLSMMTRPYQRSVTENPASVAFSRQRQARSLGMPA